MVIQKSGAFRDQGGFQDKDRKHWSRVCSMHAPRGRLRSSGSVRSQCRAPGLEASASTTPATRVAVQSWMTIVLFVAEISLSTCTCGPYSCSCGPGKYQLSSKLTEFANSLLTDRLPSPSGSTAFDLTYPLHVRATSGMEHASMSPRSRGHLVQHLRD